MEKSKARDILIVSCYSYFSFGLLWAAIGPLLAQFAVRNGTSLATIGGIYSAIFLGAVLSQVVLGPFTDRLGQLHVLTIALFTLALGIVGVSLSRWLPLTFALAFITGLGQGMTNVSGNVMVGHIFNEKSVSAVNMLNMFWGIGACIGPLLVGGSIYLWQNGFPALWFSAVLTFIAALIFLFAFFNVQIGASGQVPRAAVTPKRMRFTPFLWSMGMLLLLYVGSESAMGGWATTYMQRTTTLNIELAAMVTSGFWLALTVGRFFATVLGSRLQAKWVEILALGTAALGTILFLVGYGNSTLSIAAVLLIGLGFGPIYPTGVAMITNAFPETPGQASSVVISMSAVGGMLIPWLQGVIMQQTGIRSGTYMFVVLLILLAATFTVNQVVAKKK